MAEIATTIPIVIFGIFLLFTLKDLQFTQTTADVTSKEIPHTNLGSQRLVGPTLKILYCYSCGYKNAFEQYADMLNKKYPELLIEGGNYPPSGMNAIFARIVTITKMLLIFGIISGTDLGRFFGGVTPSWYSWCLGNKIYSCMMIFLVSNMIEGQLVSTGAFEITLNDLPVWSKLETGRVPQPPELFQIIENHLQLHEKNIGLNPTF